METPPPFRCGNTALPGRGEVGTTAAMKNVVSLVAAVWMISSCASTPEPVKATSTTEARSDADIALDEGRKPEVLVAFAGVKPGMKVADLGAGGGYTSEVLARAVGEGGVVYSQNNPWLVEKFANKPWTERLAKPVMKNVVRVEREFDDPIPAEAKDLDVVVDILFYHDTVWLKTDRAAMNKAIFDHLKSGGVYVVVDHSAKDGAGVSEAQTTHRIEQSVVMSEILGAGFVLDEESNAWREPSDDRTWNASPGAAGEKRGHSDRFAMRFKKP